MPVYTCPKGHQSAEDDFCSECGARIGTTGASSSGGATPAAARANSCPDCLSERRADFGSFCEVCGYNFDTGKHGEIPLPPAAPEPVNSIAVPAAATPEVKWAIIVGVDPALKQEGSPDAPEGLGETALVVTTDTALIGRRSEARGIFPEISLDFDVAISHRHALLTRRQDGVLALRDVGSSNGTRVNGADVTPMVDVELKEGDRITLGHWTCLRLEKR